MTELRLPAVAFLQAYDIRKNGVTDKHIKSPAAIGDEDANSNGGGYGSALKLFQPGAPIIMALRLFELLGETTLELLLQT